MPALQSVEVGHDSSGMEGALSLSAEILTQLSELALAPEQMSAVLRIIASMQAIEDDRKAKQRERTAKHRESRQKNVTVTLPERDANMSVTSGVPLNDLLPSSKTVEVNQNPAPLLSPLPAEIGLPKAKNPLNWPKEAFERLWWPVYPRKEAKGYARKAFDRIQASGKVEFEDLMEGTRRFARAPPDPQFTPHPATWLNSERWIDEPANHASPSLFPGPVNRGSREDPFITAARREIDEMRRAGGR